MNTVTIKIDHLSHWFNAIRNLPEHERTRALDAVWSGQLESKAWLVETLQPICRAPVNVYIFGGWIGILASMLFQNLPVKKIRSIDLDPWCAPIADTVNKQYEMDKWRFKALTKNMCTYDYDWGIPSDVVINTSSEHITQDQYTDWYNRICPGSLVVVQGNDYFSCNEHVRCSKNLREFEQMNYVYNPVFSGEYATAEYTRFMSIWRK
jgi:hypothetical protein